MNRHQRREKQRAGERQPRGSKRLRNKSRKISSCHGGNHQLRDRWAVSRNKESSLQRPSRRTGSTRGRPTVGIMSPPPVDLNGFGVGDAI
ncbi:MAG: hypothetical protein R3C99_05580 [Pirellulaceae bacterium]